MYFTAVIVGGSGNNLGVMVGALLVPVAFLEATRFLPQFGPPGLIDALQWIVVGALALIFLWFWPRGVIPERRRRFPVAAKDEVPVRTGWQAALGKRYWRPQERATVERARQLLARFDMSAKEDEYAGNLSGGQKRLLELMRGLMADPALLLLDEPMAGVNPSLARRIEGIRGARRVRLGLHPGCGTGRDRGRG